MTEKEKDMSGNVLTHERFLQPSHEEETEIVASQPALDSMIKEGLAQVVDTDDVIFPSDTNGGRCIGVLNEEERMMYTQFNKLTRELDVVAEKLDAVVRRHTKTQLNAMVDAVFDEDVEAFVNQLKDSKGAMDEEDLDDLIRHATLQDRRDAVLQYFYYKLKQKYNMHGHQLGIRTGWKIYDFGYKWEQNQ